MAAWGLVDYWQTDRDKRQTDEFRIEPSDQQRRRALIRQRR